MGRESTGQEAAAHFSGSIIRTTNSVLSATPPPNGSGNAAAAAAAAAATAALLLLESQAAAHLSESPLLQKVRDDSTVDLESTAEEEEEEEEEVSLSSLLVHVLQKSYASAASCLSEAQRRASDFLASTLCTAATFLAQPLLSALSSSRGSQLDAKVLSAEGHPEVVLLGQTYNLSEPVELSLFQSDFCSRPFFTYRHSFPAIVEYDENTRPLHRNVPQLGRTGIVSDVGWGCIIRASQMAVSQVLLCLRLGREWRHSLNNKNIELIKILNLFADEPSAPLSIHNLALYGKTHFGIPIGEWFGPTSCAQAVAKRMIDCPSYFSDIRPVVFPDGLIIKSVIKNAFIAPTTTTPDSSTTHTTPDSSTTHTTPNTVIATSPAIMLVTCMRLGSSTFNTSRYQQPLSKVFKMRRFQGMIGGGSQTSALYFCGLTAHGLLYLDPHSLIQKAFCSKGKICYDDLFQRKSFPVMTLPWKSLAPSVALYFLCTSFEDAELLLEELASISNEAEELFEVIEEPLTFDTLPSLSSLDDD